MTVLNDFTKVLSAELSTRKPRKPRSSPLCAYGNVYIRPKKPIKQMSAVEKEDFYSIAITQEGHPDVRTMNAIGAGLHLPIER